MESCNWGERMHVVIGGKECMLQLAGKNVCCDWQERMYVVFGGKECILNLLLDLALMIMITCSSFKQKKNTKQKSIQFHNYFFN
jgi:hypothetical protein